jgi:hypothetical protein
VSLTCGYIYAQLPRYTSTDAVVMPSDVQMTSRKFSALPGRFHADVPPMCPRLANRLGRRALRSGVVAQGWVESTYRDNGDK